MILEDSLHQNQYLVYYKCLHFYRLLWSFCTIFIVFSPNVSKSHRGRLLDCSGHNHKLWLTETGYPKGFACICLYSCCQQAFYFLLLK